METLKVGVTKPIFSGAESDLTKCDEETRMVYDPAGCNSTSPKSNKLEFPGKLFIRHIAYS